MILIRSLKLLLIVFVTFILSSDVLCQDSDSIKYWSDKDKLQWSDFRGTAPSPLLEFFSNKRAHYQS